MNRLGWEQRYGRAAAPMQRGGGRGGDEFFVPVISKTDYAIDGRQSGTTQSWTLAAGIDTVSWVTGILQIRLHARNTWASTASLSVLVENVSLVPEDPSVLFVSTSAAIMTASFAGPTPTFPSLTVVTGTGFAGMVQVRMTWAQGANQVGTQTFSISADLIGRPA